MLRAAAKATASVHIAVSAISLLHGTYHRTLSPDKEEGWMVDKHAKMYVWLPQLDLLVVEAYMGHGISSRYMCLPSGIRSSKASGNADNDGGDPFSGSRTFVKLGEEATFEDAAVTCSGPQEIAEAFRALHVAQPEFVRHPHRIAVEQSEDGEDSAVVTYYMHQRYAGILQVKSLLRVTVVDIGNSTEQARTSDVHRQTKGKPTARIVKIVEEWNGVQPMQYPPFQLSRRINGLLSWWATSLLVR